MLPKENKQRWGDYDTRRVKVYNLEDMRREIKNNTSFKKFFIRDAENEANNLENTVEERKCWFSQTEVEKTIEEFPNCMETDYYLFNKYIDNLKWFSQNTSYDSNPIREKARSLLKDLCPRDFKSSPTQVEWKYLPDVERINKVRNLMEARDSIERGETGDNDIRLIEMEAIDLDILPAYSLYFFSNAEVDKTKNEITDCKQIEYKECNEYISNLKWLSENTQFSDKVHEKARRLLQDLCPQDFESAPTQVEWKDLPDDKRINKVRNLMEARESYERGEIDADGLTVIQNEAINLESIPVDKQLYFFSNAEVKKTKNEFRDCKQIEYKEYNDYISNLELLSENTLVSKDVRNKAYSLLKELCPGNFESSPTQVKWRYLDDDFRMHKVMKLMNARESLQRDEESYHKYIIETEARDSRPSSSAYFFSNEEVLKTKKEFPDCKEIKYEKYNEYISNLKWLSENTQFSDKVRNKASSLLQDLCPRDFEFFPVATVGQDETPVALSINDYQGEYDDAVDAGQATVEELPVAQRLGGRNRKSKRRKLNGRKLSGRKLSGRKLNSRKLNGRKLNSRKLSDRKLSGRKLTQRK
jgi:hypothetical protein